MKRVVALFSMLLAAVLATGCGGGGTGGEESDATFNQADVDFATQMSPHHGQALDMAEFAKSRAQSAEVRKLAAEIEKAQASEIDMFAEWIQDWGARGATMPPHGMGEEHMGPGMMTQDDMDGLQAASGRAFDRLFLTMMIRHGQSAIEMAELELAQGKNDDAKQVAGNIRRTQSAEITRMQDLLTKL
jgi:uncharacterized protein (DUF305 family)